MKMGERHKHDIRQGFCVTGHKGIRMTFANGWSISVQWGPGNYCTPRWSPEFMDFKAPTVSDEWSAPNAEIAIFNKKDEMVQVEGISKGDDVVGYITPNDLIKIMARISKL